MNLPKGRILHFTVRVRGSVDQETLPGRTTIGRPYITLPWWVMNVRGEEENKVRILLGGDGDLFDREYSMLKTLESEQWPSDMEITYWMVGYNMRIDMSGIISDIRKHPDEYQWIIKFLYSAAKGPYVVGPHEGPRDRSTDPVMEEST